MQTSCKDNDEIQRIVDNFKARLENLLERLDWSEEGVLKNFNSNSVAPAPTAPKAANQPAVVKTPTYPESCITNNSIILNTPNLQRLLNIDNVEAPQNFNDLQANFTRDQKLQIYEHTIQNTKKLDNNTVDKVPEGAVSLADIVAEKRREAKRKKRKFRKTKPTRLEEVRALVQLQMQALQQFIVNQGGTDSSTQQENEASINLEQEESADDFQSTRRWEPNFKQRTHASDSTVHRENREKNYYKQKNSFKYPEGKSNREHKKHEERTKDCERHERGRSRSPGPSRYKEKSHHEYSEYRETTKEYDKHGRKRNRSPEAKKYDDYKSQKQHVGHEKSTKEYERRRSKSPESNKYYDEKYRRRYDRYEKSTKEYERRRSRSPYSRKYNTDRKQDKNYYRRRSKSPEISSSMNQMKYKERHESGRHKDRGEKDSRHREKHRHRKSRSRSKKREYGENLGIVKYECKIEKKVNKYES